LDGKQWLLLSYRVPAEPSSKRVAIWRKIRGLGAIYIQNGVCIVPLTEKHQRHLKMIKNEIEQSGGDSLLFVASGMDPTEEAHIVSRFNEERNEAYRELLSKCDAYIAEVHREIEEKHFTYAELQENDEKTHKLKQWFEKIRKFDFFGAPLLAEAEARLLVCEHILEEYARMVYKTDGA
jgi:hypothetical protein